MMEREKKIEVTSISSRGQIVIPQNLRKKLGFEEGDKFAVVGEGDTIVLKKLNVSFKNIDKLVKKLESKEKK